MTPEASVARAPRPGPAVRGRLARGRDPRVDVLLVVAPEVATEVRSVQPAGGVTVAVVSRSEIVATSRLPVATPAAS